jgi:hypothetical protein
MRADPALQLWPREPSDSKRKRKRKHCDETRTHHTEDVAVHHSLIRVDAEQEPQFHFSCVYLLIHCFFVVAVSYDEKVVVVVVAMVVAVVVVVVVVMVVVLVVTVMVVVVVG